MRLRRVTKTDRQLLTLETARDSLGLSWPDEQRDLRLETQLIPAALAYAEDFAGLTLPQSTWEYVRSGWPSACDPIELPRPPTICLIEFVHSNDCGDWIRVAEEDFRLQPAECGLLVSPCDCWPRTACATGCLPHVRLTYEAGYPVWGDIPSNLAEGIVKYLEYRVNRNESSLTDANQLLHQHSNLRAVGHYG